MVVLFHLICKVIKLGEWSSGMIPRLGLLPNIKFEEARGSIPRLPQFIFFNFGSNRALYFLLKQNK